ncbi:hypothetical protein MKW98_002313 [Papaver atlanticum]|uniref:Uncharacterized protein n=1 Tax=Papaver atlanticum TaxID=357466 RepID=A0AAD4RUK4_9MAGN|nr:hypothetical protein MKW98_002313 [Papaver atlanticum]
MSYPKRVSLPGKTCTAVPVDYTIGSSTFVGYSLWLDERKNQTPVKKERRMRELYFHTEAQEISPSN